MKDFIGQTLHIGDTVVYSGGSRRENTLRLCVVESFSPCKVRLRNDRDRLTTVDPGRCALLERYEPATGWGKSISELIKEAPE